LDAARQHGSRPNQLLRKEKLADGKPFSLLPHTDEGHLHKTVALKFWAPTPGGDSFWKAVTQAKRSHRFSAPRPSSKLENPDRIGGICAAADDLRQERSRG